MDAFDDLAGHIDERFSGGLNSVVRIGSTIVRSGGAYTPTVHRLLEHIRSNGFEDGPMPLAWDAGRQRDTVTFVRGPVPGHDDPMLRPDSVVISAADMLRRLHDATLGFEPRDDDVWFLPAREPFEVICHGDVAPYNCTVVDGRVTGVFDFDTIHPGPRLWDVAYSAFRWVPIRHPANGWSPSPEDQLRRLELFCRSYGGVEVDAVLERIPVRIAAIIDAIERGAAAGHPGFARHLAEGHLDVYRRDLDQAARLSPSQ